MSWDLHAIEVDLESCQGIGRCMRVCPTEAIRVKDGKIEIDHSRCIDCGECITVCPEKAISPVTRGWRDIHQVFPFTVAIPSPSLFGQFPMDVDPSDVVDGLIALGFDAVANHTLSIEIIKLAIHDYLEDYQGPWPLLSSSCPVVVRLMQVAYPDMVDQIIPIDAPRELTGRLVKEHYAEVTGLPTDQIGAIYITPCAAKLASILQPAEGTQSWLDGAIGISDIYNPLYRAIHELKSNENRQPSTRPKQERSAGSIGWANAGGLTAHLEPGSALLVTELRNVMQVLDNVEKNKIKDIEFIEGRACLGGCVGGPLTVEPMYMGRAKITRLLQAADPQDTTLVELDAKRRYEKGSYHIRKPLTARSLDSPVPLGLGERIRRMHEKERLEGILPHLDCGMCGAPSCSTFAEDVAQGRAQRRECVWLSRDRLDELRSIYRAWEDKGEEGS